MDVQEVNVTIGKDGKVEIHLQGVKGPACLDITRELEKALGGQIISREMTAEAIEPQANPLQDQNHLTTGS